ncbi:hypothetical protein ACWDYH_02055 [Nocardia goodfellowii]
MLTQLVLEGAPAAEISTVLAFCASVGLPVTLAALGLGDVDRDTLSAIATRAVAPGETIHNEPFEVTAPLVLDALRAADALGRKASDL